MARRRKRNRDDRAASRKNKRLKTENPAAVVSEVEVKDDANLQTNNPEAKNVVNKQDDQPWTLVVNERKNGRIVGEFIHHASGRSNGLPIYHAECHKRMLQTQSDSTHDTLYVVLCILEGNPQVQSFSTQHDSCPCRECGAEKRNKLDELLTDQDSDWWACRAPVKEDGTLDWQAARKCPKCECTGTFAVNRGPGSPCYCSSCKTNFQRCKTCIIYYGLRLGKVPYPSTCPACNH
jgi:hypothetical protein